MQAKIQERTIKGLESK